MKKTALLLLPFTLCCLADTNGKSPLYGLSRVTAIDSLPLIEYGVRANYEGSIDKKGANADWDWWLYRDTRGEWVLFDVQGPGCIYNFAQHRYPDAPEPTFRFYFDGEQEPRFTIKPSQFGHKHPFVEPMASCYTGPYDWGRGPIAVVRSFVPMPFAKGCRITSDIKLEGFDRAKGEGGWGHVVYHSFDTPEGIATYTGNEDYLPMIDLWKRTGANPRPGSAATAKRLSDVSIPAGGSHVLLDFTGAGAVTALRMYIDGMKPERLQDLWLHLRWDNHDRPDVSAPAGSLFGNSLGYGDVRMLLCGTSADGWMYNYFPMPFWERASITIENRGTQPVTVAFAEVLVAPTKYDRTRSGYFRSSEFYPLQRTPGADSRIATLSGTGKLVAAHVTCLAERPNIITCEGDVRVYIDGCRTPQIESDGSESYVCYGWGFPTPAECHPSGGYDGLRDNPWSMTRLLMGDSYPFHSGLRFQIESGENNNQELSHSGIVFYYGRREVTLLATDSLDLSVPASLKSHKYVCEGNAAKTRLVSFFEGDDDHVEVKGDVESFSGYSEFTVKVSPLNLGVKLRRMSDQAQGRQCARVFVDGTPVGERLWYFADRNPYKRWLEDEFEIPTHMTAGKSSLRIRIEPVGLDGEPPVWNQAAYGVLSYIK